VLVVVDLRDEFGQREGSLEVDRQLRIVAEGDEEIRPGDLPRRVAVVDLRQREIAGDDVHVVAAEGVGGDRRENTEVGRGESAAAIGDGEISSAAGGVFEDDAPALDRGGDGEVVVRVDRVGHVADGVGGRQVEVGERAAAVGD